MADLTRRKFLSRGSVTAVGAIGAMTIGSGTVAAAAAAVTNAGDALEAEDLGALEGPLFVHVRDAATGEVEVLVDETVGRVQRPDTRGQAAARREVGADMSSHREAPAISKDPVADNTDTYAFVTPGNTVTIITNYLPAEAPAGGPNFYEFGDDVAYEIHIDNNGDGLARRHVPVPVHDDHHQPRHVPLQHGTDHGARQPELEPPPDLLGRQGAPRNRQRRTSRSSDQDLRVPAVQHRTPVDAELRRRWRRPPSRRSQDGDEGVRRSAGRSVLRRPRLGVRPRHAATVRVAAPDPDRERRRRRLVEGSRTCTRSRSRCRSRS